jgi:formylglycine-generating enzyme required for sulfatase activity
MRINFFKIPLAAAFVAALLMFMPAQQAGSFQRTVCPPYMSLVPAGQFLKGTKKETLTYIIKLCKATFENCYNEWFAGEYPQKTISLPPYCIDNYEYPNQKGRTPTFGVTWNQANNLCISQGKRLCSENEWEKACAGTSASVWPFGSTYSQFYCNVYSDAMGTSGSFPKCQSPYGAFDMAGNLAEWTASSQVLEFEKFTNSDQPRIMKGGAFSDHPLYARCAYKDSFNPDVSYSSFGFRCCWPPLYEDMRGK